MVSAFTDLHAGLGEEPGPIDFDMVRRACEAGVEETEALDWKGKLPATVREATPKEKKDEDQLEVAKDIAAMANSRGGLLVYGVHEARRGSGDRHRLEPVGETIMDVEKWMRQAAAVLIQPAVVGVRFSWPTDPKSGQKVLIVEVPRSQAAPHLVRPKQFKNEGYFYAPWRYGPETEAMGEQQLDDAYRARVLGRRQADLELVEFYEALASACGAAGDLDRGWVLAVARPDQPILPTPQSRDRVFEVAADVMNSAWVPAGEFWRSRGEPGPLVAGRSPGELLGASGTITRRGLRRMIQSRSASEGERHPAAMAEMHADGTVGLAWTRDGAFGTAEHVLNTRWTLAVDDFERFGVELFRLVSESARALAVWGDYTVRLGVSPGWVVFRVRDEPFGRYRDLNGRKRRPFLPIVAPIRISAGAQSAASDALELIRDAVNQAGAGTELTLGNF